jgi:hypothetical protein
VTTRFAPRNLQGLPTLTEVIEVGAPDVPAEAPASPIETSSGHDPGPGEGSATLGASADRAEPPIDEEQLVGNVLVELQRHADLMLEYRLREAIDPALSRLADGLVRELREELAATLRDVAARAVSQELARLRSRLT